jgi:hypothetical protein
MKPQQANFEDSGIIEAGWWGLPSRRSAESDHASVAAAQFGAIWPPICTHWPSICFQLVSRIGFRQENLTQSDFAPNSPTVPLSSPPNRPTVPLSTPGIAQRYRCQAPKTCHRYRPSAADPTPSRPKTVRNMFYPTAPPHSSATIPTGRLLLRLSPPDETSPA